MVGQDLQISRVGSFYGFASWVAAASLLSACATTQVPQNISATVEEVRGSELAFAKTMADRDFQSFVGRLSPDAVFFDGSTVKRGRAEVAQAWKPFFAGSKAPFTWAPDQVEVLPSGDLALSTGLVMVGDRPVGRFNSIWRREAPHTWRIVFDKGEAVCGAASR